MPNVNVTLPEVTQSVSRPIIFDIIKQVSTITKINEGSDIFFPGDIEKMHTSGSTIDSNKDRLARFGTSYITHIEVEQDYDELAINSTATSSREHLPVFLDKALGIKICPIYATTNVDVKFKYTCPSKTEAIRWRDDIRMRVSQLRDINLHDLAYHYLMPLELLLLLKTIHEKRENHLPYNETLEEYITGNSTARLTVIGDLIAKDVRLAVSETQTRIVGRFGFDAIPEKPEKNENGVWVIEFSYKFSYEKPIACNMKYPVMVHNQLLPISYTYFTDKSYDIDKVDKVFTYSLEAMRKFEADNLSNRSLDVNKVIRIPSFDDNDLNKVIPGSGVIWTALCEVDAVDEISLLNLTELGNVIMDPDILDFIINSEYQYIHKPFASILNLSLLQDRDLAGHQRVSCDSSLNVKAVDRLNLRQQHRVILSLITDLTLLSKEAVDRLRMYPKALTKIIAAINDLFYNHPDLVLLSGKKRISILEFGKIYSMITGQGYGSNGLTGVQGTGVNSWPCNANHYNELFADIDPRVLENYRRNKVQNNRVMVTGVVTVCDLDL